MGWGRLSLRQELFKKGYAHLGSVKSELDTLSVARKVGKVQVISGLSEVQALLPRQKKDFPPNTYSGNYGRGEFPLHTDLAHWHLPPRYFLLRCITPDPEVGTYFLHFKKALKYLSTNTIERALFKPRRKLEGKMFHLRLVQNGVHRWDPLFLRPDNQPARDVTETIAALTENKFEKAFLRKQADTLLVDNWSVLHGRSAVDNEVSSRHIQRVYLSELYL